MVLWTSCFVLVIFGLWFLKTGLWGLLPRANATAVLQQLKGVRFSLHDLQETIEAGCVPTETQWSRLKKLEDPWGVWVEECLQDLKKSGSPILPTLRRIRKMAEEQGELLLEAKAKSAQAVMQALGCLILVPVFSLVLYFLMPQIQMHMIFWSGVSSFAIFFSGLGSIWLYRQVESARWGKLEAEKRSWIFLSQCAGERFLASLRSGVTPDMAWENGLGLLTESAPELLLTWGSSLWMLDSPKNKGFFCENHSVVQKCIEEFGQVLKRAVQNSLLEGRPCHEKVEGALSSLGQGIRAGILYETNLLPTKTMLPLFAFVAPSLLVLLMGGLYLCWENTPTNLL